MSLLLAKLNTGHQIIAGHVEDIREIVEDGEYVVSIDFIDDNRNIICAGEIPVDLAVGFDDDFEIEQEHIDTLIDRQAARDAGNRSWSS